MSSAIIPSQAALTNGQNPHQPSQTLYCTNLNDKLQKSDLRRALYILFSTYGPVLDVVALKTMKMRGQAFIVFRDIQTSSQAMRALQGFDFFGREMRISYAKTKSDMIARLDGTARIPETKTEAAASSDLQKSIFSAPPPSGLPQNPSASTLKPPIQVQEDGAKSPQGLKRPREEDNAEEGNDTSMGEDSGGEAMEESDSD